jgi:glycine betaine/proline transport system permease protein
MSAGQATAQRSLPISRRSALISAAVLLAVATLLFLAQSPIVDLQDFPAEWNLGLRERIDTMQTWVIRNRAAGTHPLFIYFFQPLSKTIDTFLRSVENILLWLPWTVLVAAVFLLGIGLDGLKLGLLSAVCLLVMGWVGLWVESMRTMALMVVSVAIALAIGIPAGIYAARHDRFESALRPFLDGMQTMPAFVYLIPVLLFFGVARVPSVVATVIFAIPPAIRLTSLGIRQVDPEAVEAARSFGSTPLQTLFKVQLPLAMPTIMAGVNQTIMMALGIVVIAALIGAGGLGREVLVSLQRLNVGKALEAGLAIVFLAVLLDRTSDALTRQDWAKRRGRWDEFRLLPESWAKYSLARRFEGGLALLAAAGNRLYAAIGGGLAALAAIPLSWLGQRDAAGAVRRFATRFQFLLGSLVILAAILLLSRAAGIGAFPRAWYVPIYRPVDAAVAWMRDNLYQIGQTPLGTGPFSDFLTIYGLNFLRKVLIDWLPWVGLILIVGLVALALGQRRLAFFAAIGLFFIGLLGMWDHAMDTLGQVIIAVGMAVGIGVPLGILSARSDRFEMALRPLLDFLQTIPPFVYLVPVIMLFNIGRVPGIIASVLYALPPAIRLTNLGIRNVDPETVEAAEAFGSTTRQTLFKVQLPLAMPSILTGINQTIMMVLSMVIIAGLVGGGGLGLETVTGLARNETGRGVEAGLAIVIIAVILDRLTQALARRQQRAARV